MRRRMMKLGLLAAATVLTGTACVIRTPPGPGPVPTTGAVYLTWVFPGGALCGGTPGITHVRVTIDQGAPMEINCLEGQSAAGALVTNLLGGQHSIDLLAHDATGFGYYRAMQTMLVTAGTSVAQQFTLQWIVGGLPTQWTFWNGAQYLTCAQAGVKEVYVNFRDAQGAFVYPDNNTAGLPVPCVSAQGFQGTNFGYLYYGTYDVFFQAYGTGNVLYRTIRSPPRVTVTAGSFPPLNAEAPVITLPL